MRGWQLGLGSAYRDGFIEGLRRGYSASGIDQEEEATEKLLIRTDHFVFSLGAAIPPAKWTLV